MRVEIAVGAFSDAPRDVNVEAQRDQGRVHVLSLTRVRGDGVNQSYGFVSKKTWPQRIVTILSALAFSILGA